MTEWPHGTGVASISRSSSALAGVWSASQRSAASISGAAALTRALYSLWPSSRGRPVGLSDGHAHRPILIHVHDPLLRTRTGLIRSHCPADLSSAHRVLLPRNIGPSSSPWNLPDRRDLVVPIRDEWPWQAAAADRQPGRMDGSEAASGRQAESAVAAPVGRFAVIVGDGAGDSSAWRIEAPGRLLRLRSLLNATHEQIARAALSPEGVPKLQRQLQAIRSELENTVSPPLATELRRILPARDEAPSAGALRIECAALLSWVDSLVIQMLSELEAVRARLSRRPAAA